MFKFHLLIVKTTTVGPLYYLLNFSDTFSAEATVISSPILSPPLSWFVQNRMEIRGNILVSVTLSITTLVS